MQDLSESCLSIANCFSTEQHCHVSSFGPQLNQVAVNFIFVLCNIWSKERVINVGRSLWKQKYTHRMRQNSSGSHNTNKTLFTYSGLGEPKIYEKSQLCLAVERNPSRKQDRNNISIYISVLLKVFLLSITLTRKQKYLQLFRKWSKQPPKSCKEVFSGR